MRHIRLVATLGIVGLLALLPTAADAQSRARGRDGGGTRSRAVPRSVAPRVARPPVVRVAPNRYRPYYYRPHVPGANLRFFYGYPGYFGAYSYGYARPFYGYGSGYRPYALIAPYGYGYSGYSGRPYGGLRLDLHQRDAEVYVDGYFVGTVDDFDGAFQQANIETGPHRVEVRAPGFESILFDVNVEPGRTITYRAAMRPVLP